jgi:pimeloyl-ACP methyl ester carboxylesterase
VSEPAWFSGDVAANGITIHYVRTGGPDGGGKPPLVLSHGATDNGLCWTRLARALEADYDLILPDARGHGLSAAPEGDYGAGVRAADLAAFVAALGLERPAVGGHSMGAGTALRLVADYPDVARCAILEDPGFRDTPPGAPNPAEAEARRARMRQEAAERRALGREGVLAWIREHRPEWDEVEYEPWVTAQLQVSARFREAPRATDRPDWRELLPKVTCPVLLITADPERGAIVTPEVAAEAQRLQPLLQVVRLPGAGHNVRREAFEPYLQAVRASLAGG